MLQGMTSLQLKGYGMSCNDIASPTLRCLTAALYTSRLPGACCSSNHVIQAEPIGQAQ